mmetsp:Transcript_23716/g.55294  ORF Transcript_23716/g.55294 Transcript_23716/m.55294 type:complete len:458 (-) Transcript_23716:101-1474(-)
MAALENPEAALNEDPLVVMKNFMDGVSRRKEGTQRELRGLEKQEEKLQKRISNGDAAAEAHMLQQKVALRAKLNIISRGTSEFEAVKKLGQGTYGEVFLVRRKAGQAPGEPEFFALKKMKKEAYNTERNHMQPFSERDALAQAKAQWIVNLYATFQDRENLYMLTEFLSGGDFVDKLEARKITKRFTVHETKFYMAELLVALDTVHRSGFVHRDVKPDNMAFSSTGHLKLLDFGLAKCPSILPPEEQGAVGQSQASPGAGGEPQRERIREHAGTPLYWAPEVWSKNYGKEADLWAAGVITVEISTGGIPFYAELPDRRLDFRTVRDKICVPARREEVLRKRIEKTEAWQISKEQPNMYMNVALKKYIKAVVTNIEKRLTCEECKKHPFFFEIDFNRLHEMPAPFNEPVDMSGFEAMSLPLPDAEPWYEKDPMLEWDGYEFDKDGDRLGSSLSTSRKA